MSSFRKLSLMRVRGLVVAVASINGERHVLVNSETYEIVKEVHRLLGLRKCSVCGRWIRPVELGYVEIVSNKVVRTVCQDCLNKAYSALPN
ncbi:hypothetical protein [Vulcanisaeta sp. JCM 16161]|uniref:hypothetical protein n=1 Tax=Vulcanisaeta sp. JCM 16161 TaxID=1295372 RepID=UPI0006CFE92D|nr:hypothetical protein [Vulcanisaeta sp. JCM 16161]